MYPAWSLEFSRHFSGKQLQSIVGNINRSARFAGKSTLAAIMPPKKKAANEPTKKTEQKKKEKIIEVIKKIFVSVDNMACFLFAKICTLVFKGQNFRFEKQEGEKTTDIRETSDATGIGSVCFRFVTILNCCKV